VTRVEIGEPIGGGYGTGVRTAAFSPDGKRIVTAFGDNTMRLWDPASGKPIGEPLTFSQGAIVGASPDSKRVVTFF
jgi:WD40 repeat protein